MMRQRFAPTLGPVIPVYVASDGYCLHERRWTPAGPARAQIVGLHGIQSHGGWYCRSSAALAAAGYDVRFLDRRGSGLNTIDRGHALHEDRLIRDVVVRLETLRRESPLPIVLMAVSWGGKLAAAVTIRRPDLVDALVLLYPGLRSQAQPSWWQQFQLWGATFRGWERLPIPIPLNDPALFTNSTEWRDFIRRDELALQRASISFLRANLRLEGLIREQAETIRCPVLMLLAGRDSIVDNAANRQLFARFGHSTKRLIEYPEACHTLEFEAPDHPFLGDLIGWLNVWSNHPRDIKGSLS